jgi:hypothetical protein
MPRFVMSDARIFTDYNPNSDLNNIIQKKYNIKDANEYRSFLQKNAVKIMQDSAQYDMEPNCKFCPVCKLAVDYKPTGQ